MNFKVLTTPTFEKEVKKLAKKYPSIKEDLLKLAAELSNAPTKGVEIYKNCYKIRLAIKSKGKSGGGRVITHVRIVLEAVHLLSIYDKSSRENVSDSYIKNLLEDLNRDTEAAN